MIVVLISAIALVACASPASAADGAAGSFGVSPLRVDLDARAGAKETQAVTITNASDRLALFTFSVQDIQGDKDEPAATPVLFPGKFASNVSGYDWITAPSAVRIAAGESRTVQVRVKVPADATGGHYAALIVTGPTRPVGTLSASSRIAIPFLMNAGGVPPPDIVVTEIREVKDGGTRVIFRNDGDVHTKPTGTITRTDPITRRTIQTDADGACTTALPGGVGECFFESDSSDGRDRSSLGPNDGFVELVTEDGTRARGELPTEWAGTWSSILLPVVGLALFALYFVFVRRRRREPDVAADGFSPYDE